MNKNKRIKIVDVAKGFSIILVALHHSSLKHLIYDLNATMGLFRIPLFFFLSGVFFSPFTTFSKFLVKKSDALLKPYFVTLIIMIIIPALFSNDNIGKLFFGILYGTGQYVDWIWVPLWFLTHLWTIFIISYLFFYIVNPTNLETSKKVIIIALFFILGLAIVGRFFPLERTIMDNEIIIRGLPFNLDISLLSTAFFIAGYFLSNAVKAFTPNTGILFLSIMILTLVGVFTNAEVSFFKKIYSEPFYATLGAVTGIYAMLSLSYYISKSNTLSSILTRFGFASLFILIFHSPINIYFEKLFNSKSLFFTILAFLACIILPLFIKKIIESNKISRLLYFPIKRNDKERA